MMVLKQTSFRVSILIAIVVLVVLGVLGSILSPDKSVNILGFCTLICVSLLALLKSESAEQKVDDAAKKVEQVKVNLENSDHITMVQLQKIEETGEKVHTLVNSNMGIQLKLGMELSEFKAATTKTEEDISAAKLARSQYNEHVKKQAEVDKRILAAK